MGSRERSRRSRSRDRRRSRSRSRSRRRHSRSPEARRSERSRSRERTKPISTAAADAIAAMQAVAALQQQQQLQRQLLAVQAQQHQQVMFQQTGLGMPLGGLASQTAPTASDLALDAPPTQTNKKQRELYIGNLATGVVNAEMLRELFNAVLSNMVPDPITTPPVLDVKIDPTGRFSFVELRTAALALAALHLDKVELCGRQLNIGRPKGYIEPPAIEQQAKLTMAQMFAAQVSGGPTNVVLLENLMLAIAVQDEAARRELYDDVYVEVVKCGAVAGLCIPTPPKTLPPPTSCRVYIRFSAQEAATRCKAMMDGREFDGNLVKVTYVTEQDYFRAQAGEWL